MADIDLDNRFHQLIRKTMVSDTKDQKRMVSREYIFSIADLIK